MIKPGFLSFTLGTAEKTKRARRAIDGRETPRVKVSRMPLERHQVKCLVGALSGGRYAIRPSRIIIKSSYQKKWSISNDENVGLLDDMRI